MEATGTRLSVLGQREGQCCLQCSLLVNAVVHKCVIGKLVPVQEVLQEVGALVAGVTPGHG